MAFVAVEELRSTLPAVSHLWVADRDDSVRWDTFLDPPRALLGRVGLGVLLHDCTQQLHGFGQWR